MEKVCRSSGREAAIYARYLVIIPSHQKKIQRIKHTRVFVSSIYKKCNELQHIVHEEWN